MRNCAGAKGGLMLVFDGIPVLADSVDLEIAGRRISYLHAERVDGLIELGAHTSKGF